LKPTVKLAETLTPDGALLTLYEHDGEYCIRVGREELMHSSHSLSELLLGELATEQLTTHANPTVLIGGLGLGYTLRAVLGKLSPDATVHVAELMPAVVEWNRKFLTGLNGSLLDDPRVQVMVSDVWEVIARAGRSHYDAVMLDIDNGPDGMVQKQNNRLYQHEGLRRIANVLKMSGRATIWSAWLDHGFIERLTDAGFTVRTVPAKLYPHAKRCAYTIFVADK
jgi:spermidine synthase